MRFAKIVDAEGSAVIAILQNGHAYKVSKSAKASIADIMRDLVSGDLVSRLPKCTEVQYAAKSLLRPIDDDARILCAGFNFSAHAVESDREQPSHPTFFARFSSGLVGPNDAIERPYVSDTLDWEGELAVMIGKGGRDISVEEAFEHVGGYLCFGDHSIREFQTHSTQATAGKNFDRSGAAGPWVVTPDELPHPDSFEVFTSLNGERVQHGQLSNLLFSIPELISYASKFMELRPGDVIATGTPSGIGARRNPPRFLQEGDEISVEVPGIGTLTSHVINQKGI
ncbi:fumarylacetoacetate hydrolase family protein [Pseudomonas gingeri]|uniref:fumarylacetoacetate hydrolase family protein n=1 Tax=Pseudomonas gingeri TaxID=117681 RepID=UPI0015A3E9DE|nr:fumarylacetoacetate hydrolase family protein [Pseudomonas gingeri]NWA28614.1 fumarylacetoacetate hydrolase family protein [Pseudomonas gingeri]